MSSINSVGANLPVQKVATPAVQKQIPAGAPAQLPMTDKLELSGMSHLLSALKANNVRTDKIAGIRAQLDKGTYETDDKLNVAVDRLLDDVMG